MCARSPPLPSLKTFGHPSAYFLILKASPSPFESVPSVMSDPLATALDDLTVQDVDSFLQNLHENRLTADDVHALAVSLSADATTGIDPTAVQTSFQESSDFLGFLCWSRSLLF